MLYLIEPLKDIFLDKYWQASFGKPVHVPERDQTFCLFIATLLACHFSVFQISWPTNDSFNALVSELGQQKLLLMLLFTKRVNIYFDD